jgi:NADH:ubiquinone oxidoreductase subunit 2 (subunit N)
MRSVTKYRLIFIVSLVVLVIGIEVTGRQKEAQSVFLGLLIYFLIAGAVFGCVWLFRQWSIQRAKRESLRQPNLYLKKNPVNYQLLEMQMKGRIKRDINAVKSTRWN